MLAQFALPVVADRVSLRSRNAIPGFGREEMGNHDHTGRGARTARACRIRGTNFGAGIGECSPLADRSPVRQVSGAGCSKTSSKNGGTSLTMLFTPCSSLAPAAGAARCTRSAPMSSTSEQSPRARGTGRLCDFSQGRRRTPIVRDRPRHAPSFRGIRPALRPRPGRRRLQGLPFRRAASTPLLSFSVRHLRCDAGIMVTASHNPPSDNGFKCYGRSGGQVIPPDDAGIIACVASASDREIPEKPFDEALADGSIRWVDDDVDLAYITAVVSESVCHARDISIVYTPLHGVGETSVARVLKTAGFRRLHILASQRTPDGDFPNVPDHVANPEYPRTLEAAIADAKTRGADLVIASDPDADRIGVAVPTSRDPRGDWTTLDGNQIGVMLSAFVIKESEALGRLRSDHYLVSTLVSTPMARALAEREGVRIEDDLLVGFKWIAHRIDQAGHASFLFAFEESHGYLKGNHARDKDAAVAAFLFAELAAAVKDRKQTVLEYLDDLYIDVGHYGDRPINKMYTGREGLAKIKTLMKALRDNPPRQIGGLALTEVYDYKTHEIRALNRSAPARPLPQPDGDLLIFHTDRPGTRFAARPSGTEPKIKFYLFARTAVSGPDHLPAAKIETKHRLDRMAGDLEKYLDEALICAE